MQELSHFLNGAAVKGGSGRFADVMNPATGEVQARVPLASKAEVDAAVASAAAAQQGWGATNPQRRGAGADGIRPAPEPRHGQAGRGAEPRARQDHPRRARATCSAGLR